MGVVTYLSQRYCRLIQPEADWHHWTQEAEDLHGISRDVLLQKGTAASQVCEDLNNLLRGQTVYSDGWVVDYPWLIKLFSAGKQHMKFKFSPLENILSEKQMELWHDTQENLVKSMDCRRHRASCDAELVQNVYMQTQHDTELTNSTSFHF
ncbi:MULTISPECIES: hypothetical protein [Alteromonadaceae]|uniref:hypothetical protein n=1 Tax=Alteromonadaceae TaxID=72275 RepID=UPI0026E3924F|nr:MULTISPECIES: hypothetical protein [unclassified Aliiglaciecola]MDO6711402.1 hypothetical protein [Aliiglaciecola sp. 2_MG-2023]MDO6752621.1 hypothetical protein [Aliiglaciecola sp. 1_MG-2023]